MGHRLLETQGGRVGLKAGSGQGGAGTSSARRMSAGTANAGGRLTRRYVYMEVFQISAIKVRLSLQRAKESIDTVYVGIKPGQMLLDLIGRMDSAHIKARQE